MKAAGIGTIDLAYRISRSFIYSSLFTMNGSMKFEKKEKERKKSI